MLSSTKAPGMGGSSGVGDAITALRLCVSLGLSSRSRSDESLSVVIAAAPRDYDYLAEYAA